MAYRKTEKVLAQLAARKDAIIAAAIAEIAKHGVDGMTVENAASRANVANGTVYLYFADRDELLVAVYMSALARDLEAMRRAADGHDGLRALARAVEAFYAGLDKPKVAHALAASMLYRNGILDELVKLIGRTSLDLTPKGRTMAAAGALGALYAIHELSGGSNYGASAASLFVLKGIGVSDALARKVAA